MVYAITDNPEEIQKLQELEKRLTPLQKAFAINILKGISPSESYRRATHKRVKDSTAWVEGSTLRRLPKVAQFIQAVREAWGVWGFLDWAEKRVYLRQAIETGTHELFDEKTGRIHPETAHLVQKVTVNYDKEGNVTSRKVEGMSKGQAMLLDNALAGHVGPPGGSDSANDLIELERMAARIRPTLDLPAAGSADAIQIHVVHEKP